MMKTCVLSISFLDKLGVAIHDILLSDSSIHSVIFRHVCTTKRTLEVSHDFCHFFFLGFLSLLSFCLCLEAHFWQNLYVSRLVEPVEIEGFQLAISSALDILYIMISKFSEVHFRINRVF